MILRMLQHCFSVRLLQKTQQKSSQLCSTRALPSRCLRRRGIRRPTIVTTAGEDKASNPFAPKSPASSTARSREKQASSPFSKSPSPSNGASPFATPTNRNNKRNKAPNSQPAPSDPSQQVRSLVRDDN